jgi:hypothetical protein
MATTIENRIEATNEMLQRADSGTRTLFDVSKSLGAIIIACGYLVEIIEEQQRAIECLEDVLQDSLERRR